MDLALHLVRFALPGGPAAIGPEIARAAQLADEAGVVSLSFMDHYFQMDRMFPAEEPMLEGYTSLGFVAGQTSRLRLGLLVTGVTYRHPGLLAKIVTTLDVLSGGRAELGIGAAWYEREHRGLGVDFPPLAERFERLEETLQICLQMWSDDNGPYQGRHYRLDRDPLLAATDQPAAPADPHRGWRGAQDAAPRRPVRRRLQPVRQHARGDRAQVRRAAPPLRRCRPRPRRDPQDHPLHRPGTRRRGHGRLRGADARLRPGRRGSRPRDATRRLDRGLGGIGVHPDSRASGRTGTLSAVALSSGPVLTCACDQAPALPSNGVPREVHNGGRHQPGLQ